MVQSQTGSPAVVGAIVSQPMASLDAAKNGYGFAMLAPIAVPAQFTLSNIQHGFSNAPPGGYMDTLVFRYTTTGGDYLAFFQGTNAFLSAGKWPDGQHGTATVQGKPAVWTQGLIMQLDPVQWQRGPTRLHWMIVPFPPAISPAGSVPSPAVGAILESDSLTLEQLVAIANSVQPYR